MTQPRLKIAIVVAGCGSQAIGEAQSSYQWVSRLARLHDVTVLTVRNSKGSPTALELPGVRVIEWPDLAWFERWPRFNAMLKPGYVVFYFRVRRWLQDRLQAGENFDLIHQLSPLALRYPSPAAGLGVPFVMGPLGGSLETPEAFGMEMSGAPWYTRLRAMDGWRLRHDPWLRHSYASADALICVAPYVKDLLAGLPSGAIELVSETGVGQLPPPRPARRGSAGLRLLFVGRVIRSKGVRDAIRAMAQLRDLYGVTLDVVGDGEDLLPCKEEAQTLGLAARVHFHGRIPRAEVDKFYSAADVFVFPSFREPSGNAVIEAMSHGLAMIVADRGGPGFVVDDACGFRVPSVAPAQFAADIANCIRRLAQQPALIEAMGRASREKIERQFLWDAKVERMSALYRRVLNRSWQPVLESAQRQTA